MRNLNTKTPRIVIKSLQDRKVCEAIKGIIMGGAKLNKYTQERYDIHLANCPECKLFEKQSIKGKHA